MNSNEHWVEIEEFPRYLVSQYGRVVNRTNGHILKPFVSGKGYHYVSLSSDYGRKNLRVHRLVYASFFDCDISGLEINHVDGDKLNNRIWNLEVATSAENTIHAIETGLSKTRQFYPTRVRNVDTGEVFPSSGSAARSVGVTQSRIAQAIRTAGARVRGYRFDFVDEED